MPIYVCRCDSCGKTTEQFARVKQRDAIRCDCGSRVTRVPTASKGHADYTEPERCSAAGIHPDQIDEARTKWPSCEFDPQTGEALFRSRAHRKKCLKERRMIEGGSV